MFRPSVCCDASLLVRTFEPKSLEYRQAIALFDAWARERVTIIAPSLILFEVTNAVYRAAREERSSWQRARTIVESLSAMPIEYFDGLRLLPETLEFARQLDAESSYDAHYLSLAKREGVLLYTADHRLADASKGRFHFVRDVLET